MTITLIGATGKAATLMAPGLQAEGQRVRAAGPRPRRGPRSARPRFPAADHHGRPVHARRPADRVAGADAASVALGSISLAGNLACLAIVAAGLAALPQLVRLSLLNTSPTSLRINQRAHCNIDCAAAAGIPTPRTARRSSPPAPRSAPAGPGPGWRTDCIRVGKNATPASNRREPAHRPGEHRRKGLDSD